MIMSVTILLPTYNEEENISLMIDRIHTVSSDFEILVVDSNSTDQTIPLAKKKGAKTVIIEKRGKGLAVGIALKDVESDYLIVMDSDLTYPADAIPTILEKLKTYDVVLGSRFKGSVEKGAMTPVNKIGNLFLTTLATLMYQKSVSDVCTGMWGFTKKAYKQILVDAPHFELEVNFFVEAVKRNLKICELPIDYKKRGGKSKLSIKHGFDIALYLVKKRF